MISPETRDVGLRWREVKPQDDLTQQTPLRHSSSLLQFRQKIRQIKELFQCLNFSVLVELEEADAFQEEGFSGFGRKTVPPFDGGFLTAHPDIQGVEFHLTKKNRERFK